MARPERLHQAHVNNIDVLRRRIGPRTGTTIGKPTPQLISLIGDWNQISAGGSGTVALRD
jgi:hypothetical protein